MTTLAHQTLARSVDIPVCKKLLEDISSAHPDIPFAFRSKTNRGPRIFRASWHLKSISHIKSFGRFAPIQ